VVGIVGVFMIFDGLKENGQKVLCFHFFYVCLYIDYFFSSETARKKGVGNPYILPIINRYTLINIVLIKFLSKYCLI